MELKIKKALEGNLPTLIDLYKANVQKAYSFSFTLLNNKTEASKVVSNVFTSIWKELELNNVQTEDDFSFLVRKKTVSEARKAILRENPKGMQIPKNQNFNIASVQATEKNGLNIFSLFSPLQKIIFLSRVVFSMTKEQIAKAISVDITSVNLATIAEKNNIEKLGDNLKIQDVEKQILDLIDRIAPNDISDESEYIILESIKSFSKDVSKKATNKSNSMIYIISCAIGIIALIVLIVFLFKTPASSENTNASNSSQSSAIDWVTSVEATDYAVIDIKNYGKISVALDSKTAPITVTNFKDLAKKGFYDGLTFHRIISDFMIQGGDPEGNGTGDSGKDIKGEFSKNGVKNNLSHVRGAISMARGNPYDSGSCQFFIVHQDSLYLNENYAAFGYVVSGMDIVDRICADARPTDDNGTIPASEQPIINSIKIYTVEEFKNLSSEETESSEDSSKQSQDESENEVTSSQNESLSDITENLSEGSSNESISDVSENESLQDIEDSKENN